MHMCTINVPLPVGPLLGRGGAPLHDLDLAGFGSFRSEDALVLAAALRGAAGLQSIRLPAGASLETAAMQALTSSLLQLPALAGFNGVELLPLQSSSLDCSSRALGPIGGVLLAGKVRGVIGCRPCLERVLRRRSAPCRILRMSDSPFAAI